MKTTAPEHYRVKPTVGVIEPGQTVEVSVQLTPGRETGYLIKGQGVFLILFQTYIFPVPGEIDS